MNTSNSGSSTTIERISNLREQRLDQPYSLRVALERLDALPLDKVPRPQSKGFFSIFSRSSPPSSPSTPSTPSTPVQKNPSMISIPSPLTTPQKSPKLIEEKDIEEKEEEEKDEVEDKNNDEVDSEEEEEEEEEDDYDEPFGGSTPIELLLTPDTADYTMVMMLTSQEKSFLEQLRLWGTSKMDAKRQQAFLMNIPGSLRGLAWRNISGTLFQEKDNLALYYKFAGSAVMAKDDEQIRKDLGRTVAYVNEEQKESLYNVLHACALYDLSLGYCQGMSYIAALLLEVTGGENETFWLFVHLINKYKLAGLWEDGLPLLKFCLYCLDRVIGEQLPKLFSHFKSLNITPLLLVSGWISSLFAYGFPPELTAKIWDVFIVEGIPWILKVTIAILQMNQDKILTLGFEPLLEFFKVACVGVDPNLIVKNAMKITYITPKIIGRYKSEFYHPSMEQARKYL